MNPSQEPEKTLSPLEFHASLFQPTEKELLALKKYEHIQFREITPDFISKGRQSRVSLLEYEAKSQKNRGLAILFNQAGYAPRRKITSRLRHSRRGTSSIPAASRRRMAKSRPVEP